MEGLGNFKALQDSITTELVAVTRSATHLASQDLDFQRSSDPSIASLLDRQNARLLSLAERLVRNAASTAEVVRPLQLSDLDSVEGNWRGIVDVVDSLLEKADISLDEYTGAVKRFSPQREQTPSRGAPLRPSRIASALRSQDVSKPQLLFQHVPTNAEKEAFKPLLESKPHAVKSLDESLTIYETDDGVEQYPHPYEDEIRAYEYPSFVYSHAEPIPYLPFESTTATLVDTEEAVEEMLEELKKASEIAIDLEHHDLRSYIGVVSLMQISTRNRDWIVDTLKPWRRKLSCLNEVFADPRILKVLHGAFMDATWLQRDLGLYLVGLFDTHHASRALSYPGGSLAFLLKKFVDFDAQKQYQTADWRIRPLPTEMFDYARSDTHFLLYIYDNMRNELIEKSDFSTPNHENDKIHYVLNKSKDVALQTYQHPIYDAERGLGPAGWYRQLKRTPALLTREQFAVFKAVHQWRDQTAREQDDSAHYVMAQHNIFTIAKEMPSEKAALLSAAQPLTQTVRLRADELLSVIANAKDAGKDGPEMIDALKEIQIYLHGEDATDAPWQPSTAYVPHGGHANQAVAPYANRAAAPTPTTTTLTQSLRSSVSSFWGSTFGSSFWQQRRPMSVDSVSLAVPLPPLTAQVFADPSEVAESGSPALSPSNAATPAAADPNSMMEEEEEKKPDVFTLKDLGRRKRKSDQISREPVSSPHAGHSSGPDGLAAQQDTVDIDDYDDDDDDANGPASGTKNAAREQKRAAKKAAKRAAKQARIEGKSSGKSEIGMSSSPARVALANGEHGEDDMKNGNGDSMVVDEPFDYTTAPSVLTSSDKKGRADKKKKKDGKEKPGKAMGEKGGEAFNPYAKALDAPKGLPRAQKERAGRSMTFRS